MGTESRILQHLSNLDEVAHRVETAANAGCFIEVISLRLQVMDFWLRIYFYNVLSNSEIREREFGRLLKQTFRLGLDKRLYDKLVAFNKSRVSANHGFFIGAVSYETIGGVATDADSLLRQTVEFVVRSSGKAVASRNDLVANPGAMTLHVEGFCADVRDGKRY